MLSILLLLHDAGREDAVRQRRTHTAGERCPRCITRLLAQQRVRAGAGVAVPGQVQGQRQVHARVQLAAVQGPARQRLHLRRGQAVKAMPRRLTATPSSATGNQGFV